MITNSQYTNLLQFEILKKYNSLFQFSTTIAGGVSKETYTSFNLGPYSGDNPVYIAENRNRLANMLQVEAEKIFIPYQTHGEKILFIDNSFLKKTEEQKTSLLYGIDALITDQTDICIGVTTADCVPVLIFDPVLNILAVIHAGWRGTVNKLVIKTIEVMHEKLGCKPENLIACIGPSISPEFFEIGNEVVDLFYDEGFKMETISFKNPSTGKIHIDLWTANKLSVIEAGISVQNIEIAGICTYKNSGLFFSARRQGINSGRMLTGGVIR